MRCHTLHGESRGCEQEIPEPGTGSEVWSFCPECGRSTAHIVIDEKGCRPLVRQNVATTFVVPIYNRGLSPTNIRIRMLGGKVGQSEGGLSEQASLLPSSGMVQTSTPLPLKISIPARTYPNIEPYTHLAHLATLEVIAGDGILPANNTDNTDDLDAPWQPVTDRTRRISSEIYLNIQPPASVKFIEEVALFRENVSERIVTLVNEGGEQAELLRLEPLPGYEIREIDDTPSILGGKRLHLQVKRDWRVPTRPLVPLVAHLADGSTCQMNLRSDTQPMVGAYYQGVLGIDFGTTFTSIAFRQCYHDDNFNDPMWFLRPPGETEDRFPTLAWIDKTSGELAFGSLAEERYKNDPTMGFLIREFKTLLREPNQFKIYPERFADQGLSTLRNRLGEEWGQALVIEYLRWLNNRCIKPELRSRLGEGADVRYVFSIPVLDYNLNGQPQYLRQRERMQQCIAKAGFPLFPEPARNRVDIEFEPVCAMVGLLHPPQDVVVDTEGGGTREGRWPQLKTRGYPLDSGDRVSIYDSGGGTTDVVLAEAKIGEDGKVSLTPIRCLGVGSSAETFGGEWVTGQIYEALTAPTRTVLDDSGQFVADWFQGSTIDFTNVYEDSYDPNIMPTREKAVRVKFDLTNNRDVPVALPVGSKNLIRPRLLARLLLPRLKSLIEELKVKVFDTERPDNVKYYLFVGGNTRIPFLRDWIQRFMRDQDADYGNRRLLLPERYRQLAIAYGGAWVPDARVRNSVNYDVSVYIGQDAESLLTLPRHESQDIIDRRRLYGLAPGSALDIRVMGTFDDPTPSTLTATRLENLEAVKRMVEVSVSLHGGEIKILYRPLEPGVPNNTISPRPLLQYKL